MDKVRVLVNGLRFPEGPTVDKTGCVWCVEQEGEGLFCRDQDGSTMRVHTGGRPGGTVIHDDYLWFSDSGQHAIRRMNTETKAIDTVFDTLYGQPLNRPNGLLFDKQGNLIFTCPGPSEKEDTGYMGVYSASGMAEIIADGLSCPTGLAFFPTNQTLLLAETHKQRIWQGFWDGSGLSWETIRVWSEISENTKNLPLPVPNGMAVGPDKNLYVALFGAGLIRVLSPDGALVRDIALPGKNPTNCTFDLSGELGLIVTESERGELLSITSF